MAITTSFQLYVELDNAGSVLILTSSANVLPLGQWSHVAMTRQGTTVTAWANGVSVA